MRFGGGIFGRGFQCIGFNTQDSAVANNELQAVLGAHTSWNADPNQRTYLLPADVTWSRMVLNLLTNANTVNGARFFSTINDAEPAPTIEITVDQATGEFLTEDDTTVSLQLVRGDEARWEYAQGDSTVGINTIGAIFS